MRRKGKEGRMRVLKGPRIYTEEKVLKGKENGEGGGEKKPLCM